MRKLILSIVSLISVTANSQNKFEEMVSTKSCNCLSGIDAITIDDFTECMTASIIEDKDLLEEELVKNKIELSKEGGYAFGKMISTKLAVSMIFTCDKYYQLMESGRETMRLSHNKDSLQAVLLELNKKPEDQQNSAFYRERGVVYFLLTNFHSAISDFDKVLMEEPVTIKMTPNSLQSMVFKAWSLEQQGNYDESIAVYDKLIPLINKPEFLMLRAITQRKKSEKK